MMIIIEISLDDIDLEVTNIVIIGLKDQYHVIENEITLVTLIKRIEVKMTQTTKQSVIRDTKKEYQINQLKEKKKFQPN
jgi:hypothetical protein